MPRAMKLIVFSMPAAGIDGPIQILLLLFCYFCFGWCGYFITPPHLNISFVWELTKCQDELLPLHCDNNPLSEFRNILYHYGN